MGHGKTATKPLRALQINQEGEGGGGGKQPCLPSRSPKRLDDVCVHKCGGLSRGGVPVVRRGGVALVA